MRKSELKKLIRRKIKELNTFKKPPLGRGADFTAYNFINKPHTIIKYGSPKIVMEHAQMFNKYPKYFPKVYKVYKTHLILEKLSTHTTKKYVELFIKQAKHIGLKYTYGEHNKYSIINDIGKIADNQIKPTRLEGYKSIISSHPLLKSTADKLTELYINVSKAHSENPTFTKGFNKDGIEDPNFGEYRSTIDFHSENIGTDSGGNWKMLDF